MSIVNALSTFGALGEMPSIDASVAPYSVILDSQDNLDKKVSIQVTEVLIRKGYSDRARVDMGLIVDSMEIPGAVSRDYKLF